MTHLEGKPCKVRYSDAAGAKQTHRTLWQRMKSNSPFPQQQPLAHQPSWALQHCPQPSSAGWHQCATKPSPFSVSWATTCLLSSSRTAFWLGLQQRLTEVQTSCVLMRFLENNVGFVEEENLHLLAFRTYINFLQRRMVLWCYWTPEAGNILLLPASSWAEVL